jgi:hypothetical protein
MSIRSEIYDSTGESYGVKVTSRNQLVVAPLGFSTFYSGTAGVNNTAVNLIEPKDRKNFIITEIILYANKNVGASDASVELYEAAGPDVLATTNTIILQEMQKNSNLILTGLNIIVTEGFWVNLKTDDDDIFANIAGYYVDKE